MENPIITGVSLSDVRVIMIIMHVLAVELSVLGGDVADSSARVFIARHVWALVVMSHLVWH
jgi:hypothetical protein